MDAEEEPIMNKQRLDGWIKSITKRMDTFLNSPFSAPSFTLGRTTEAGGEGNYFILSCGHPVGLSSISAGWAQVMLIEPSFRVPSFTPGGDS